MREPGITYYEMEGSPLDHARDTLSKIAKLASGRDGAHNLQIRRLATRITAHVPSKQIDQELAALYMWARDNIRYRFDPVGIEWVQAPWVTVQERAGDCDDFTTLLSALVQSLGHRVRYRTVGPTPKVQKHVTMQAWNGKRWIDLDPVLEPAATSTAPRADLGMFGRRAPGSAHHFDTRGTMLNGYEPSMLPLWSPTPLERDVVGRPQLTMIYRSPGSAGPDSAAALRALPAGWRNPFDLTDLSGFGAASSASWGGFKASDRAVALFHWNQYVRTGRTPPGMTKDAKPTEANLLKYWQLRGSDNRPIERAQYKIMHTHAPAGTSDAEMWKWFGSIGKEARRVLRMKYGPRDFLDDVGDAIKEGAGSLHKLIHAVPGLQEIAMLVPGLNIALPLIDAGLATIAAGGKFNLSTLTGALPFVSKIPGVKEAVAVAQKSGAKTIGEAIAAAQKSGNKRGGAALASLAHKVAKQTGAVPEGLPATTAAKLASDYDRAHVGPKKIVVASAQKPSTYKPAATVAVTPAPAVVRAVVASTGASYPAGSRQTWDAGGKRWLIQAPRVVLSGMGALKPSFTFSFGATAVSPTVTATPTNGAVDMGAKARAAIAAVRTFINKNGSPPQIKIKAVGELQAADPQLSDDSLWGPNTRRAAAFWANVAESTLPPVAKPYQKYAITWEPVSKPAAKPKAVVKPAPKPTPVVVIHEAQIKPAPEPYKPKPTAALPGGDPISTTPQRLLTVQPPTPAPKPVAPKPATSDRQSAAKAAVSAVRAFMKNHDNKPPAVTLPAVGKYQALRSDLKKDSLWGNETRAAVAADLRVDPATLPPVAFKAKKKPAATKPASKPTGEVVYTTVATSSADPGLPLVPGGKDKPAQVKPAKPKPAQTQKPAATGSDSAPPGKIPIPKKKKPKPATTATSSEGGSNNTLLWLAAGYWYLKHHRKAA